MFTADARAIAARIRAVLGDQVDSNLEAVAERLNIAVSELRSGIDPNSPRESADLLARMVVLYGLDPAWLVYGVYDLASHREALEADPTQIRLIVARLLSGRVTPQNSPIVPELP